MYERRGRVVRDSGGAACGGGLAVDVVCAAVRRDVGGGVRRGGEGRLVTASDGGVAAAQPAVQTDEHVWVARVSTTRVARAR